MSLALGDPLTDVDDDLTCDMAIMKALAVRPLTDYLTSGQISDVTSDVDAISSSWTTPYAISTTIHDGVVTDHLTDIQTALDDATDPVLIAYAVEYQLSQAAAVDDR